MDYVTHTHLRWLRCLLVTDRPFSVVRWLAFPVGYVTRCIYVVVVVDVDVVTLITLLDVAHLFIYGYPDVDCYTFVLRVPFTYTFTLLFDCVGGRIWCCCYQRLRCLVDLFGLLNTHSPPHAPLVTLVFTDVTFTTDWIWATITTFDPLTTYPGWLRGIHDDLRCCCVYVPHGYTTDLLLVDHPLRLRCRLYGSRCRLRVYYHVPVGSVVVTVTLVAVTDHVWIAGCRLIVICRLVTCW